MHHSHSSQQGLPPPHIQHQRSAVIQHHQDSPHQAQTSQQPVTGPYASPHIPSHSVPAPHQSPYVAAVPGPTGQPHSEVPYYTHASFSGANVAPSYSSADNIDPTGMATAAMNRGYPPMYTTPQSASPASVQSPQHDQHQRPMYQQPMYAGYPPYPVAAQSPYGQHPVQPAPPMNANFIPQHQGQPMPQHQPHQVPPAMAGSPDVKIQQSQIQRQTPGMATPGAPPGTPGSATGIHHSHHAGSSTNPNAAPGPIPATTPLVVRQDQNGVQWIAFEYSRDRVKMEYTIRCDVESIDVNSLTQDFKTENCVYPRACCPKDQYKGNRLHYESECNTVGWALAQLNPCLRGKRGLIQRAVDSWRNSNQDPRLRSRRVRRMAKINNRTKGGSIQQQQHPTHMATAGAPGAPGVAAPGMPAPGPRQPGMQMGGQLIHHHHEQPGGGPPGGTDDVSAGNEYNEGTHTHHHQAPNGSAGSPNDMRQTHNFYPSFPASTTMVTSTIPTSDGMGHVSAHPPSHGAVVTSASHEEEEDNSTALFGDLPEAKRRKFILVDDAQRGTRVRVRVMLDQVRMAEMPDSYRKNNSVYPRSWFATEMQSPPSSPRRGRFPDDVEDEGPSVAQSRVLVPVPMMDGSESKLPVPRMTRTKRNKEVTLNDLGYRMSWSQSRVFSGRTLFLQRSLDAYRNKMRSTMAAAGQDFSTIAPHFETRVGKRKWVERARRLKRDASP